MPDRRLLSSVVIPSPLPLGGNRWKYGTSEYRPPQYASAAANWGPCSYKLKLYRLHYGDVILSFRHAGLKRLFERGDGRRVSPELNPKVKRILARLDEASEPEDMNLPGFRLHLLRGNLAGYWAVRVSGNWRIVFRFEGRNVRDVHLVDYH